MSPRSGARRRPCTQADARSRAALARAYLDTARLVQQESGEQPDAVAANRVAAGNAVLAAIAASDALCCALLGERSREQGHRAALDLLGEIRLVWAEDRSGSPSELVRCLALALDMKDEAHYGTAMIGRVDLQRLLRAADKLVTAAQAAVQR